MRILTVISTLVSRHTTASHQFFSECHVAEEWMKEREERLNSHFAQSDFKLDEGEGLLKEMQQMRDELSAYEDEVSRLIVAANDIVPLRARRERLRQPIEAIAICKFQSKEVSIFKGFQNIREKCLIILRNQIGSNFEF